MDAVCFANGLRGPVHKMCAQTCFKRGEAAVLMTDDGTGWLLFSDHGNEALLHRAKDLAGERVVLTGLVRERGGLKGLSLLDVRKAGYRY